MKYQIKSLGKKSRTEINKNKTSKISGVVIKRKLTQFKEEPFKRFINKEIQKEEEILANHEVHDNQFDNTTKGNSNFLDEESLKQFPINNFLNDGKGFCDERVRGLDQIECSEDLNDEDKEIFDILKSLSIILEGASELVSIGHVKNSDNLYLAFDLLDRTKRRNYSEKCDARDQIRLALNNIFLGDRKQIYLDHRQVIKILLNNLLSHASIEKKDIYNIYLPCEPRRDNIEHYLYQCINDVEVEENLYKEFEIPSFLSNPKIKERIDRFSKALNLITIPKFFQKIGEMKLIILPFSSKNPEPHPVMKILDKIIKEEIQYNKKISNRKNSGRIDAMDIEKTEKRKTIFVVSSSTPCDYCQNVIKEMDNIILTKNYHLIYPCYEQKPSNNGEFFIPDFLEEKFYKNEASKKEHQTFIDLGRKLKHMLEEQKL